MKKTTIIRLLALAAFLSLGAISCQKEKAEQPSLATGEKISININGRMTDFLESVDTKAFVQSVFRMTWVGGETVYVFGENSSSLGSISCLGSLTASVVEESEGRVADLSGSIYAPSEGSKLTLVYSPEFSGEPAVSGNAISIDLSAQTGTADAVTFVAYATVDYKGEISSTYRTSFKFATSVLRVNASNLAASTELTSATLGTIETTCKLTFATNAEPAVAGDNATGTITRTLTSCSANAKGNAAFYIAVPKITEKNGRSLTVTQSGDTNDYGVNGFATGAKDAGNLMNSIVDLMYTGQRGFLNGQEYVVIRGNDGKYLKWATQNLAVTASGKGKWNGTNYVIGDYFQWAAYVGYVSGTKPENLVIYTSFTNDGSTGSVSGWKDSKQFNKASAPYGGASYTKYTSGSATLDQTDDVANIVLGGTWRMPAGDSDGEFKAMRGVTYWAWDATDKGYYVFKPGVGTSGAANGRGDIAGTDDKTKALLFFPAAGFGNSTGLGGAGDGGRYWSSTLSSSNADSAFSLNVNSSSVNPEANYSRYRGFSVRPVSD